MDLRFLVEIANIFQEVGLLLLFALFKYHFCILISIQGIMANEKVSGSRRVKKSRKKRSRYAKIPLKAKLIFFRKVIHQKGDLRDVPLSSQR